MSQKVHERWPTCELLRKIDGALFELVALARDTKRIVVPWKRKRIYAQPFPV
jgi:hypothetical protein